MKKWQQHLRGVGAAACLILSSLTFAGAEGGGMNGGGGSFVVIDGKVVIADPYFAGVPARTLPAIIRVDSSHFPKELAEYIKQSDRLLSDLMGLNIRAGGDFFIVPPEREGNIPCDHYVPLINRPVDENFQYGCTFNGTTFLFSTQFARASVMQQYLGLIHERLWNVSGITQEKISAFVTLVGKILPVYESQMRAMAAGRSPTVIPGLQSNVETLYALAKEINIRIDVPANFHVTPHGGVIGGWEESLINIQNAVIGLGTMVNQLDSSCKIDINGSTLLGTHVEGSLDAQDSSLLFSNVKGYCGARRLVIKSSRLVESKLEGSAILDDVVSSHSTLYHRGSRLYPTEDARAGWGRDFSGKISHITLEDSYLLGNLTVSGTSDNRVSISRSSMHPQHSLEIQAGVRLDKVDFYSYNNALLARVVFYRHSSLNDISFKLDGRYKRGDRNYLGAGKPDSSISVTVWADTHLSHGKFNLTGQGHYPGKLPETEMWDHRMIQDGNGNYQENFRLGDPKAPFTQDLAGVVIEKDLKKSQFYPVR